MTIFSANRIMLPTTVYYSAGSDPDSAWTNEAYAWDGSIVTNYASRTCVKGTDETTKYLLSSTNAGISGVPYYRIGRVRYAINTKSTASRTIQWKVKPVFGGATDGDTFVVLNALTTSQVTYYYDITNGTNAPNPWTWDDVLNLDLKSWGHAGAGSNVAVYVYEIWLEISFVVPNYGGLNFQNPGVL